MRIGSLMLSVLFAFIAVAIPVAALASESVAQVVPALDSLPAWAGYVVAVLYGLAHAVTLLPASVTGSWPSWIKSGLNLVAANYGKAKNRDG